MMHVAVVGAGFAGLAAAEALASSGYEPVVFEARDRVGGRVHSAALANGAVVELGAEFVLPGNDLVHEYARRLGLRLFEKGTLYGNREPRDGPAVTRLELEQALSALAEPGEGSVAEALERRVGSLGAREAIGARVAVSTAHELDDQPAAVLAEGAAAFGDYPTFSIAGGNDGIARELAARLRVELGTPVERIAWDERGVIVTGGGQELVAAACVVATPAPHALEIEFDPPLPGWKREALAAVRYGRAAKLQLPLAAPAPPSATLSVPGRFWIWTQNAPGGGPLAAASSFAGSPAALAGLALERGAAEWLAAVQRLRPDLAFLDAEPLLATWADDPWARGAYSARSLSSPLDEEALARPVGPIAFAGEHTAGEWHGLMEGALRSARRAAGQIRARSRVSAADKCV